MTMADPDCASCEAVGLRACNECGTPFFPNGERDALGRELCADCV